MYILAGKKKLADVRANELQQAMDKAKVSGLPEDAQAARDLADQCERFEKKLYDLELEKQQASEAAERRSQIGTGDRSEKIRTYNFPQGRVTDHRIKLTLHKLDSILNGDLDEIIDALTLADQAEKLRASAEET